MIYPLAIHSDPFTLFRPFLDNLTAFNDAYLDFDDFSPNFNVEDNESSYTFSLSLPGFKREEVSVEIQRDNYLVIKAEKGGKAKHLGISRSMHLGDEVDPDKVTAKLEDGILTIVCTKRELPEPRKIALT